jgi:hypothetical protein
VAHLLDLPDLVGDLADPQNPDDRACKGDREQHQVVWRARAASHRAEGDPRHVQPANAHAHKHQSEQQTHDAIVRHRVKVSLREQARVPVERRLPTEVCIQYVR